MTQVRDEGTHPDLLWSKRLKRMRCEIGDGVVAVGAEARDFGDGLDAPARAAAADKDDEVNGVGDEVAAAR